MRSMPMVGRIFALVLLALFCCAGLPGGNSLEVLFRARDLFALRDAVATEAHAPAWYRGAVACAFNDAEDAERCFADVRDPAQAAEAHGMLAHLYMRSGRYRKVYEHLRGMQQAMPDFAGLEGALHMFSAIARHPELSVARRSPSYVEMTSDFFLPLFVNGKPAEYGFDTGMDISFMSEKEANRLGLQIEQVPGSTLKDGASGNDVPVRFAVARTLRLGGFELRNVVFTVAPNDAMPFVELPASKQGIIGLPVLAAFGRVSWDRTGRFGVGGGTARRDIGRANLCFHAVTPMIRGSVAGRRVNVWLDTGASSSYLTARFARDFPDVVSGADSQPARLRGVGGSTDVRVSTVPQVTVRVGRSGLVLRPARVLPADERVDRDWHHVWLGMDVMSRGATIDFEALTFSAE